MDILKYDQIAFILIEMSAFFLIGGLLWFTTPFRKRGKPEDRLFFALELCCLIGILSDCAFFLATLKLTSDLPIPLTPKIYAAASNIFSTGPLFFDAVLFLYVSCLFGRGYRFLRVLKIPVLLVPAVNSIINTAYAFLPKNLQESLLMLVKIGAFSRIYYVFLILALIVLLFVDKKLVIYYLLGFGIWILLSRIIPMLQYTAILHAQILVFTYIIVIKRELKFALL